MAVAAVTAPVLDIYGTSLTAHPPVAIAGASTRSIAPRFDQRAVDIDGTLKSSMPLGWAIAGDALGGGYSQGRTIGDVNLATGSYSPTEIDLALPTLGLPVVIGRTYNNLQQDGSGTRTNYSDYQGWNWTQLAQPQITLVAGATADLDVIYLNYGNDRFIELKRTGLSATDFKAKNGAAGVVTFTAASGGTPELYTYHDQRGNQIIFFGYDVNAGFGAGQLWKMTDAAGNVAYVHSTTASTAAGNYSAGLMQSIFDASGRKYVFSYVTVGGAYRLQSVEAQINSGGWTTVEKVEYTYYTSTDNDKGLTGDLRLVKITHNGVVNSGGSAAPYVRYKYYRYYTRAWSNSDGRRGEAHSIKMVVGFDGTRQYDILGDNTLDQDYYSETDANLMPYAEAYFEYPSGDYRLAAATFNGNCGCAGGTSGTYSFAYTDGSTYSTEIGNTSYDTAWARRTVIAQPDGTYVNQYFDETGAPLSRVLTNTDPSGSPTRTWVYGVDRDSNGLVTTVHSPANSTGYTHSSGALTYSSSVGLVTTYGRHSASDNLDGLRENVAVREGTSGSSSTISSVGISDRQQSVGGSGVSVAQVDSAATYPSGSALTTSYSYTYWSTTATDSAYITPKVIIATNPTVTSANNGSTSATTNSRYLREDGTTAFTKDEGGVLFYTGRSAYGQTATQIADHDGSTLTNVVGEDKPGGTLRWSLSASGSGTPAQVLTTMTYDDQGRMLTRTEPSISVNGFTTRTSTWRYVLDSFELGTLMSPLKHPSTNYYHGPLAYRRVNHAGLEDRRATIEIGTPGASIPTSVTPNTSAGTSWSAMVDTVYDSSGMRAAESWTYTSTGAHDTAYFGYDAMGRRSRIKNAPGTVSRTVFDERGLATERWTGTDDTGWTNPTGGGAGSANMVKIEALEYDGGSAGGNGYLTARSQDSTGAWSGGVGDRVTTFTNDYRGRAVVQGNPVAPHTVTKYDNSNRATAAAQYSSTSGLSVSTDPTATSASTRVALSETAYDERGQVCKSTLWEIVQGGGSAGNKNTSRVTDNWYDDNRRLVKTLGQEHTKTAYDRLGRVIDRFTIAKTNDSTTYSAALDAAGDEVLEQVHMAIDPATGRPLAQWTVQRAHDDYIGSSTGPLDTNADGLTLKLTAANLQNNARAQITSMWYDDLDRVSDTVAYGTYGGSDFNRSGLGVPSSSATALLTHYAYDDSGRLYRVTDPAGIINQTTYDFAGRKAATIDNYVNGTPQTTDGTNHDQDRLIDYAYTNGQLASVTREMKKNSTPHDNDQVTTYTYGTTLSGSQVATGHLLSAVTYPDTTATAYTYTALSQVLTTTDPAGNEITTGYDAGGRVSSREVTSFAGGFDTRVKRIETAYNSRGMVSDVLQKNSGGTVLDEVALTYDGWGNLASETQDPDSAIGAASGRDEFAMSWAWARSSLSGGNRAMYLTGWTQPDGGSGMSCSPSYEVTGFEPEKYAKRVLRISDDAAMIAEYVYMGRETVVGTDHPETSMKMTFKFTESGSSVYSTYMDRFNRPILNRWRRDITGTVDPKVLELAIDYDLAGNVTTVQDNLLKDSSGNHNFDYLNGYDNLRRLTSRKEGALSAGAISSPVRKENSGRNLAGRIIADQVDLDGNGTYTDGPLDAMKAGEMDDARTYDVMNRLTGRSYTDSVSSYTPTLSYDANGNLTNDGESGRGYTYVYNPWGQLVSIADKAVGKDLAEFHYNGLGQRIAEKLDTSDSGDTGAADGYIDGHDPWFLMAVDPQGRRVATYRNTDQYPKETFVYNLAGLSGRGAASGPMFSGGGGVLVRARNSSLSDPTKWATETASVTRDERTFYSSDFRGNVCALVDESGVLVEQYRYSPSGVPWGIHLGDVNGDGAVSIAHSAGTDWTVVNSLIGGTYQDRADLNLDGVIDSLDTGIVTANDTSGGGATGKGLLSIPSVSNAIAFSGLELRGYGLGACLVRNTEARNVMLGIPLVAQSVSVLLSNNRIKRAFVCNGDGGGCQTPIPWPPDPGDEPHPDWPTCIGHSRNVNECMSCCGNDIECLRACASRWVNPPDPCPLRAAGLENCQGILATDGCIACCERNQEDKFQALYARYLCQLNHCFDPGLQDPGICGVLAFGQYVSDQGPIYDEALSCRKACRTRVFGRVFN